MAEYIDKDKAIESLDVDGCALNFQLKILKSIPPANVIERSKIDAAIEEMEDEKDFAYADFDVYKEEVLGVDEDELPNDDFRYGMERSIEILKKHISEKCEPKVEDVVKRSVLEDIKAELWDSGMNMTGKYQGIWVRYKDIEKAFDKHISGEVEE